MAFRQPTLMPTTRPISVPAQDQQAAISSLQTHALDDSHEWVLFPSRESAASYTQTTSADRTSRTARLSRLSDFGSLNTAARSGQQSEDGGPEGSEGLLEEDEGLDSLDDGLHAFQEPSKLLSEHFHASSNSILPRHDGLGGFPTSTPGVGEHDSWFIDQDGTASRKRSFGASRRRTSINMERGFQEAILEDEPSRIEEERRERIEHWRLEHSRVLLDEVEKETRRRRASFRNWGSVITEQGRREAALEGFGQIAKDQREDHEKQSEANALSASVKTHATDEEREEDNETFWQRVTRRVIRDFIGIDDTMLAIILGESLPEDDTTSSSPPSKAPRLDNSMTPPTASSEPTWEKRLVDRVTRELGILLSQLSEQRSAFNAPALFNPTTSDYAGIPITQPTSSRTHRPHSNLRPTTSASQGTRAVVSPTSFTFGPTIQGTAIPSSSAIESSSHAALWGIEEEPTSDSPEQEYWESSPGLKEIFERFLHIRFPSPGSGSVQSLRHPTSSPSHNIATTTTPDRLRRAALIRQHHPLTSRTASAQHRRRRSWLRGGSSCASESARRSRAGKSSLGTNTSRNYWDLGGSSIAGSGVGGWGEV